MAGEYNVGSDTVLTIISNGQVLASQILTHFNAKQITTRLKSVGLDGVNRYRELEEGWEIELRYDRGDSSLDAYFAAKEAGRYDGQAPPTVTVTENTTNPDTTMTIMRYDGVTLKYDDIGNRAGDAKVEQRLSGAASRRIQVA